MKVWIEREDEALKEPYVDLEENNLRIVNNKGKHVVWLFGFDNMLAIPNALNILKDNGYRTDFAEWGENGEMVKLLEHFE